MKSIGFRNIVLTLGLTLLTFDSSSRQCTARCLSLWLHKRSGPFYSVSHSVRQFGSDFQYWPKRIQCRDL